MDYRSIIESRYNRHNWQSLLHDIFGSKIKFWNTPSAIPTNSQFAKQALWLGTITLSDEQTISVYEVELSDSVDIERNRRGIRDMLLTSWRNNGNAGAFMFCYRKNESVLRFSYVSESWSFADDGSYQKESTDTKRFTYLLGEGHRSRTAIQQFEKLRASGLSLKDLTKAFSVDAVGDMFFDDYKKQYAEIIFYVTGKRMVKVANKWEERQEGKPCKEIMQEFAQFPDTEKAVRDYVKKLMGRLVFLQFLQKKGWLGVRAGESWGTGDTEFIQTLFAQTKDKDHFIDNTLEALFNDLNSEDGKKLSQYRTPYLNGGLFERDATDETNFPLPAKYMQQMLDFFASYNFTIDENDPDDAEVGVDPEMLGRIFENLLEDNKDKGAFYTPKEIVTYMCRESLIAYLQTDVEDVATKEAIRQFVTTHDIATLGSNSMFIQQVDDALKDVKICDPAIGSGAFPMGLLKELFLCRTAIEGIEQSKAAEIKKHIIQQNIYGVDIERGAVDIARLRFWLSLIVDEETPQALPNLDFKIMQGNSLLEQYQGADLSTMTEKTEMNSLTFFDDMIDVYRKDLRDMLNEYYGCTNHKRKKQLREKINANVKQQLKAQSVNVDLVDLDVSGNDQFFLWHTWFYDVFSQGGFDIVIGNPPYVKEYTKRSAFDGFRESSPYYMGKMDLWYGFACHGIDMMRTGGIICFIAQNNWTTSAGAKKMREKVMTDTQILQMLDFNTYMVFESAEIQTMIMMFRKNQQNNRYTFDYRIITHDNKKEDMLALLTRQQRATKYLSPTINRDYFNNKIFTFSENNHIFEKIERNKTYLEEKEIGQGIVPALDDYFILYKIDNYNEEEKRYIKPYYTGIKDRFVSYPLDKYLVYMSAKNCTQINLNNFPNLKSHFEPHRKELIAAKAKYGTPNKPYFFVHRERDENFFKEGNEKIVSQVRCKYPTFYYTKDAFYGSRALFFIRSERWNMKFLVGVLNSKLIAFWIKNRGKQQGELLKLDKEPLLGIPLPFVNEMQQKRIIDKVEKIIVAKGNDAISDTSKLETEIDFLVYHIYDLTFDDVLIIDPETPITREEYDSQINIDNSL